MTFLQQMKMRFSVMTVQNEVNLLVNKFLTTEGQLSKERRP